MIANSEMFSRPNDQAKIHDFEAIQPLWAPVPNRKGFRTNLKFGERNGAMRITVFPNQEEGPKVVSVGFDAVSFDIFLRDLGEIARGPKGVKTRIENQAKEKDEDSAIKPEESSGSKYYTRNTLHFGKDEEGFIWLGIEQKDIAFVRFKIETSMWHHFYKTDGTRLTREEGSMRQTLALIEKLRAISSHYAGRLRPPYEKGKGGAKPAVGAATPAPSSKGYEDSFGGDSDIPY